MFDHVNVEVCNRELRELIHYRLPSVQCDDSLSSAVPFGCSQNSLWAELTLTSSRRLHPHSHALCVDGGGLNFCLVRGFFQSVNILTSEKKKKRNHIKHWCTLLCSHASHSCLFASRPKFCSGTEKRIDLSWVRVEEWGRCCRVEEWGRWKPKRRGKRVSKYWDNLVTKVHKS